MGGRAVSVGDLVSYDATRSGTAFSGVSRDSLRYSIAIEAPANGLSSTGATVFGQPVAPGITWATIVATDPSGRTATDRFAIVVFAAALASNS